MLSMIESEGLVYSSLCDQIVFPVLRATWVVLSVSFYKLYSQLGKPLWCISLV